MELHVFALKTGGGRRQITADRTGSNLPAGEWLYQKTINVARGGPPLIGANSDEIVDAVEKSGYFTWPVEANDAEGS